MDLEEIVLIFTQMLSYMIQNTRFWYFFPQESHEIAEGSSVVISGPSRPQEGTSQVRSRRKRTEIEVTTSDEEGSDFEMMVTSVWASVSSQYYLS